MITIVAMAAQCRLKIERSNGSSVPYKLRHVVKATVTKVETKVRKDEVKKLEKEIARLQFQLEKAKQGVVEYTVKFDKEYTYCSPSMKGAIWAEGDSFLSGITGKIK